MAPRPLITLLTVVALLLASSPLAAADDLARRKKMVECVNKEFDKENKEAHGDRKLTDDQLKKFKKIVDDEIMKEPLRKPTAGESKAILRKIEGVAKKDLRELSIEKVDKIMASLKKLAYHCGSESIKGLTR